MLLLPCPRAEPLQAELRRDPPLLVERDNLIEEFAEALEDGPGSPGRATIYTGAQGSGKTVLLDAVEDRAKERGWVVVSETATSGFVERIVRQHLPDLLEQFDPEAVRRRLTGLTGPLGSGGATWSAIEAHLAEAGLGNQIGELRELATTVQHAFREDRGLAFVGAGLAAAVSDVVNDDVLTFLRRAERHHLGIVGRDDVARAIREPIEANGRRVSDDVLVAMVEGTRGYPFLIQLVGSRVWRLHPSERELSMEDARIGVSDTLRRLDVDVDCASQYRLRLIAAELIEPVRHGYVDFAVPYLREYLRSHATAET